MRATLFHNPSAGSEKYPRDRLMRLVEEAGFEAGYRSTKREGWATAVEDAGDLVVVAGGDGTIAKVAKKLTERRTPLAILPTGTANNIATSLGIVDAPEDLVSTWDLGRTARLDVAFAEGPWGKRRFIESVGLGLFAHAIALANHAIPAKNVECRADELARARDILRRTLKGTRSQPYELALDGETVSGDYLLIEVMSTTHLGPGIHLAPAAHPGDGRFDTVLVDEDRRDALDEILALGSDAGTPLALTGVRRCSQVTIAWAGQPLHIDDRVFAGLALPAHVRTQPVTLRVDEAVEVLVPPERPLE